MESLIDCPSSLTRSLLPGASLDQLRPHFARFHHRESIACGISFCQVQNLAIYSACQCQIYFTFISKSNPSVALCRILLERRRDNAVLDIRTKENRCAAHPLLERFRIPASVKGLSAVHRNSTSLSLTLTIALPKVCHHRMKPLQWVMVLGQGCDPLDPNAPKEGESIMTKRAKMG